ncbi:uncharacterized protein LOC118428258 isoform X1 [Branchiostoma floridae]|uniref:Uncharacterized protein LOC118428258 isoform X1 n=2 Tax=Branchiostoma floridae TaxID=7739 RepID=A0A9J7M542_BRAFL|nr:uncharacterized protein LOC118428258 isoform X1 [Branchiostoma floridae]
MAYCLNLEIFSWLMYKRAVLPLTCLCRSTIASFLRLLIQFLFFSKSTMGPFILFFIAMVAASPVKRQEDLFGLLDLDGDGRLSRNEVLSSIIIDQALLALDSDGDGFITGIQIFELTGNPNDFPMFDANNDGKVSYDEIRQGTNMLRVFDRFDADDNGFLEGPEAAVIVFIYSQIVNAGLAFLSRDQMDTNGDQILSRDEVLNALTLTQVLVAADDDNDGAFTQQQIENVFGAQNFQILDDNMDGVVSFGEFRKVFDLGDVFDFFDSDADGVLTGVEQNSIIGVYNLILNLRDAIPADPLLDTNSDGQLSKDEVVNAMTFDQIMVANDADGDGQFTELEVLSFFDRVYFRRMDVNGDGFVTFDEMRAVIDVGSYFDYLDADGNGFLDGLEQFNVVALYYNVLAYQQANGVNTK